MIDESRVLSLISQLEAPKLDFKRELHLETAKGRAELVKDIIANANSGSEVGYLIYGVDNNKQIFGISDLNEEQIQQIVHSYIIPPVIISCELIPLSAQGFLSVGIITVKPTSRPHKVRKSLDKIIQDDVFIRRGSITTKATPEEIIQMYEERIPLHKEVIELQYAAETHLKLGNYLSAITLLSKAIEIAPTAEMFLARADAFHKLRKSNLRNSSWWNWGETALKDLADAITLSNSPEVEARARKLRQSFENFAFSNYTAEQRNEDFEFEKQSRTGIKRGKWIYEKVVDWDPFDQANEKTISLIQEAIQCGYNETKVYLLLAEAYHGSRNYGFALKEIDQLLRTINDGHEKAMMVKVLCVRAKILIEMGMYQEAYETFLNAKNIDEDLFSNYVWITPVRFEEDILLRLLIDIKFNGQKSWISDSIVLLLAFSFGREVFDLITSQDEKTIIKLATELDRLEKTYPKVLGELRKAIGDKNWQILKTNEEKWTLNLELPSVLEVVKEIQKSRSSYIDKGNKHYLAFVSKA